jgi:hypothetical protein
MKVFITAIAALALVFAYTLPTFAQSGPPIPNAIWVDGILFGVTLAPNMLPDHGPKDGLYNFGNSGLTGQRSVGESKPGDQDYNGGRWQVTLVAYTPSGITHFDPDGDGAVNMELTSWEDVGQAISMGYLEVTGPGPSFTCPLHRQNGNGHGNH